MAPDVPGDNRLAFGIGRLFDLVSDAVIIASATSGNVVRWNPGAAAMFGIEASEAVGMPLTRLVPPELRERHTEGLARYARGEPNVLIDTRQSVELPALRADGASLWIELQLSSVPQQNTSDDRYVIAIVRDITARRLAEAEVIARNEELRSVNDSMRLFLAAVAHDIVGPAGGIKAAADLLVDVEDRAANVQLAGLISRQADLVIGLGRDLGQLAIIEEGDVPTRPVDLSLGDVVTAAVEASPELRTIGVTTDVASDLHVFVDGAHAVRIVSNLLGNASKYGEPPILVEANDAAPFVELRVRDRGPGVRADFVDKLFDKFTREHNDGVGLGLGLAISKGLAQANGGDIWYEPDVGGATFAVRFPMAS